MKRDNRYTRENFSSICCAMFCDLMLLSSTLTCDMFSASSHSHLISFCRLAGWIQSSKKNYCSCAHVQILMSPESPTYTESPPRGYPKLKSQLKLVCRLAYKLTASCRPTWDISWDHESDDDDTKVCGDGEERKNDSKLLFNLISHSHITDHYHF